MSRKYRLRLAHPSDKEVNDSTVDASFVFTKDDIGQGGLPNLWGAQNVRPLEGSATTRKFTVTLVDRNNQITSNLSDSDGKADVLGRIGELSIDDGSGWVRTDTGRVTDFKLVSSNPTTYEVVFGDELSWVRDQTVFKNTLSIGDTPEHLQATTSLWPSGIIGGWRQFNDIDPITWEVEEVGGQGGNIVALKNTEPIDIEISKHRHGIRLHVVASVQSAIQDDRKKGSVYRPDLGDPNEVVTEGDFHNLRFRDMDNQADRELRVAGVYNTQENVGEQKKVKDGWFGGLVPSGNMQQIRIIRKLRVVWPSNGLSPGTQIDGYLYQPGAEPSQNVPLHLGKRFIEDIHKFSPEKGMHALEYAMLIFDRVGARYNKSQIEDKVNERDDIPALYPRITEPQEAFNELRKNVFKPYGFIPTINGAGEIEIHDSIPPTQDSVGDITNLPEYDKENIDMMGGDHPSFAIVGDSRQKTIVKINRPPIYNEDITPFISNPNLGEGKTRCDGLSIYNKDQKPLIVERGVAKFGKQELSLQYSYLPDVAFWNEEDQRQLLVETIAHGYLDRYNQGAVETTLNALPRTIDPDPGQIVRLNLSSYPNLRDQDRGGVRLLQVLSNGHTPDGREVDLLDLGPELQPLPAPSISATGQGPYTAEITLGGSGGTGTSFEGDYATVWAIPSDTDPSDDNPNWKVCLQKAESQGTYTIRALEPNQKFYFRARQYAEKRITSDYSGHASATTDPLSAPSNGSVVDDLGCAVVIDWTNSHPELKTQVTLDGQDLTPYEPAGSQQRFISDLGAGTTHTVELRHIGKFGGVSSAHSFSFTTKSSADKGPPTGALYGLVGEPV